MRGANWFAVSLALAAAAAGCHGPEITAVPLSRWNQGEPNGIPFYLPKPLLIIAKNFRYVEEAKVGLTDSAPIPNSFDDQSKYADLNARTTFTFPESAGPAGPSQRQKGAGTTAAAGTATASAPRLYSDDGAPVSPAAAPADGLLPETFFTYQIVFVPDLTQKYGLRIKGGPGEIRAAMNLVNGWQFTGLGPYYMKDSSTAQNLLAGGIAANLTGRGVADVVRSLADLRRPGPREVTPREIMELADRLARARADQVATMFPQPVRLADYAEIHVFEPRLTCDGTMEWIEIADFSFDRQALGYKTRSEQPAKQPESLGVPRPPAPKPAPARPESSSGGTAAAGPAEAATADRDLVRSIVAHTYGLPQQALVPVQGQQRPVEAAAGPTVQPALGRLGLAQAATDAQRLRPPRSLAGKCRRLLSFQWLRHRPERRPTSTTRTILGLPTTTKPAPAATRPKPVTTKTPSPRIRKGTAVPEEPPSPKP